MAAQADGGRSEEERTGPGAGSTGSPWDHGWPSSSSGLQPPLSHGSDDNGECDQLTNAGREPVTRLRAWLQLGAPSTLALPVVGTETAPLGLQLILVGFLPSGI